MGVFEPQPLVEQIHASGRQLVIAATGGGSVAISALLQIPGASASVLEAVVPYASTALSAWLGGPPDHYCSERTARAMAMAAFERARRLSDSDPHMLRGIGATASLATARPKRGTHRAHVAWQSAGATVVSSCTFGSERSRADEEQLAAEMILDSVAEACGVGRPALSEPIGNSLLRREQLAPVEWTELLLGQRKYVAVDEQGSAARLDQGEWDTSSVRVLLPGAFNPLHSAHRRMAEIAAERYGSPVAFELSITNVDKPALDFIEIADRLSQFQGHSVLLSRAATFVEKAQIAASCLFVVGVDTVVRIGDPVYYGGDASRRDAAIAEIARSCRFLVFGRVVGSSFRTLSDFHVPPALRALCDEVPEWEFRQDVSSTELRGGADHD
jgi:nicotinamide mononucleotide (NMN) deamidase PncC